MFCFVSSTAGLFGGQTRGGQLSDGSRGNGRR
jgi:hypothetical protein